MRVREFQDIIEATYGAKDRGCHRLRHHDRRHRRHRDRDFDQAAPHLPGPES